MTGLRRLQIRTRASVSRLTEEKHRQAAIEEEEEMYSKIVKNVHRIREERYDMDEAKEFPSM